MSSYDRFLKSFLRVLIWFYIVSFLVTFYFNYTAGDMNAIAMGLLALLTPWIIPIFFKLCKFKAVYEIYICNICFVYFASLIGSSFHGYSIFGFDKVVHFFSGVLLTILSMIIFMIIKKVGHIKNKEDYVLFIVFINAMNLAIAVFWEFFEYFMLIFFNNDCINHYTQGVHDSMTDMLCAFVGGILVSIMVMQAYKHKKENFITNLCEKFYALNIEPRWIKTK